MAVQNFNDDTNDYDLTNLFYLHNLPSVPSEHESSLKGNAEAIDSWLSLELTKAEEAVGSKLKGESQKSDALPSDSSIASKLQRIGYRIRHVNARRECVPWLIINERMGGTTHVTAAESEINLAVLHAVLGLSTFPRGAQVINVVKLIGLGILNIADLRQDYAIHIVDHQLDSWRQVLTAVVKTFAFNITMTEVSSTGRGHGAQSEKHYQATIEHSMTTATFDFGSWYSTQASEEIDAAGRNALAQRQLRLVASSGSASGTP